ncbi:MAG: trigger factor [Paludibacter sp.]|nr:trigger factor [Paludibacter sp.]MBP6635442.1 trigger factor [Paludibacter sp.]
MNIVRKDIDQSNATLTLRIEKADYAEKVQKTLRDYRKKANIPGFRPGMVPVGLITKMYGKAVIAEEINKIVSDELFKYIKDNNINMLGEPMPNETEQKEIDFNTQEDFEFVFDLGLAPEFDVEVTGKDKVKYYNITVSDEMIENQLKSYTSRYGKYVQEETVEEKDMLKGEMLELANGKVNESGIKLSDAVLTPAYIKDEATKALFANAKKGDVITINPAKAFEDAAEISSLLKISKDEAKNITSDFQFKIEGITRYHESAIDQELFDKVYGEGVVTSEEEFKAKIKANIQESLQGDSDYKFGIDARDMLLAKYDNLVFPDAFLKRWVLATNENLTVETLEADYSKMIADLKWQLIKDKIAKANDTKIETSDIEEYAKKITKAQFAQYGMVGMDDELVANYAKDMLKKEETLKGIIEKVAENKVFDVIKATIKLETKEISIEDFNKMFEN